jgi:hypothetical protein
MVVQLVPRDVKGEASRREIPESATEARRCALGLAAPSSFHWVRSTFGEEPAFAL